ncbi:MAG: cytochrome P450 [Fimbriimonas sp.]|nr:cytochrome P450 [Fimbriimonas sp.]
MQAVSPSFEEIIVTPGFLADPYPVLRRMREEAPVYWSDAIGGWLLTRYDDVMVTFKDTAHFSNENRLGKAIAYLGDERQNLYPAFAAHFATKSLLHSDPPDHTRMRSLIAKEFNAKVVEQMKPAIQDAVDRLIDAMIAKGAGDIVTDLAAPLPISVIAQILGVPPSDRHLFKIWTDDILAFQGVNKPSESDLLRAERAISEIRPYIRDMVIERRKRPSADLVSKFVAAEHETGQISETELISTLVTLFVAGQETTLSFIANTMDTLLRHPDQLDLLRRDPSLISPALEEGLRFESPVSRQPRLVKEDVELGSKRLSKGEMVFQMINAANRDPAWFDDSDRFDIRRANNKHIAFGHGIHFCVGALLARAEAPIAIQTAISRLPGLQPVSDRPDWDVEKRNSRVLRSLKVHC